jgi:hypothetical protein
LGWIGSIDSAARSSKFELLGIIPTIGNEDYNVNGINSCKLFFLSLASAILMLLFMHAPFEILNPGSAIRWRVNFEQVFYLAPILLMLRFIDVKTKENPSLSS